MAVLRQCALSAVILFGSSAVVWAAPDTTMSVTPTATAGTTITASDENSRNSAISTAYNAHSHTDIASTSSNTFTFGDGAAGNKNLCANAADSTDACIRWNDTANLWTADNPIAGSYNQILVATGVTGLASGALLIGTGTGAVVDDRTLTAGGGMAIDNGANAITFSSFAQAATGNFTRDTTLASGSQTITGISFTPVAAIFFATQDGAAGEASWGMDAGTTRDGMQDDNAATTDTYKNMSNSILDVEASGVTQYAGQVSTFNTNGFTISWTKTGSPTGTLKISYLVFR